MLYNPISWGHTVTVVEEDDMSKDLQNKVAELEAENAQLKQALKEARMCQYANPTTLLPDRRIFFEKLSLFNEFASPGTYQVLFIDIDHFKKVNDTYGHPVGDGVLREVSQAMLRVLGQGAELYHISGEEFAVIVHLRTRELPEQLTVANIIAERLLQTVKYGAYTEHQLSCTISIGVTNAHFFDKVEDVYDRADKAMYLSKQRGRDQVTLDETCCIPKPKIVHDTIG